MNKLGLLLAVLFSGTFPCAGVGSEPPANPARQTISLGGDWLFRRDGDKADAWKTVELPSSFERHEGIEFNGVGWYEKSIAPFALPAGKRALLHFQAAATEAEVWWNGEKVGSHLGGWTPFRFDITDQVRKAAAGKPHELRVRLDEKVGHNTQGFLPIIAPHFGGLWQNVDLLVVPETYCDDLNLLAIGDLETSEIRFDIPLSGKMRETMPALEIRCRLRGESDWTLLPPRVHFAGNRIRGSAAIANPRLWSPDEPNLYELEIALGGKDGDLVRKRAGFRTVEVFGPQLRLNGWPLQVRGLLNWGYSPPLTAPHPGEAAWREELEYARRRGFNMMKFCLWIPPQRYFELADELGMMVWMEYPTWHPTLTRQFLEPLQREFGEFFNYDRNHPSVILRSLTCETGGSAELSVIRSLYDQAKKAIPGAIVVDDSSWIGWNRINDFYDDHPYGNNHTWVKTLQDFNEYIRAHGLKPMMLGEAIAADTWIDREALAARLGDEHPWWAPGVMEETFRWEERMRKTAGSGGIEQLRSDSLRYGLLMRKFQIEAYRREIPYGGYNVSVIRDIPNASMGLLDYSGQPKWSEADWAWQRDTMCLFASKSDRRSFTAGERLRGEILLSHFGPHSIEKGELEVTLRETANGSEVLQRLERKDIKQNLGTLARLVELDWPLPPGKEPRRLVLCAALRTAQGEFRNDWPLWIVPAPRPDWSANVRVHASLSDETAAELFPGAPRFDGQDSGGVVAAARFDDDLVRVLENGGRVLLLPDGQKGSFPLNEHWFLRGAPYLPDHALSAEVPRDLLVELQHFDLSSPVVPEISYLDAIDPILMLWDTHDLKTVKTHGLVFETRAAKGRLLVSAVRHAGRENAAGRWLLQKLVAHLNSTVLPRHALPDVLWGNLKKQLHAERIGLVESAWLFKPDPRNEGLKQGWQKAELAEEKEWKKIRIGANWESQDYPNVDGWAWYRTTVEIPARWKDREFYLSFEGVDDIYELYVNGQLAGKGGDFATHTDAFNDKKSHNLSRIAKPGEKAFIAVRVYDWGGAGGLFRPVTLGTAEVGSGIEILKQ
ncbi:MAG: hypothetical protein IT426_08220 [Pirellulales bacterium]|nr:hypothetical protein [Pirellulales bacterium]